MSEIGRQLCGDDLMPFSKIRTTPVSQNCRELLDVKNCNNVANRKRLDIFFVLISTFVLTAPKPY